MSEVLCDICSRTCVSPATPFSLMSKSWRCYQWPYLIQRCFDGCVMAFVFTCRSLVSLTWLQSGNECNIFTVNATVYTVLCNLKISPATSRRRWSLLPPIHFRESVLLNGTFHSPSPAFGENKILIWLHYGNVLCLLAPYCFFTSCK